MIRPKAIWNRTPRKYRLAMLAFILAALMLVLYTFSGSPTLSIEQKYRRAEKAHLVGPGNILGIADLENNFPSYWNMVIADDGDGIIFYCYNHANYQKLEDTQLIYRKKTGDITVLGAPFPNEGREMTTVAKYPVFVFDTYPDAVRAELDITLQTTYSGENFTKTYHLKSQREQPGYFQFTLGSVNPEGLKAEGHAMQVFALISGYGGRSFPELTIPATVRLFDESGSILCERSLEISSVVKQSHDRQGDKIYEN